MQRLTGKQRAPWLSAKAQPLVAPSSSIADLEEGRTPRLSAEAQPSVAPSSSIAALEEGFALVGCTGLAYDSEDSSEGPLCLGTGGVAISGDQHGHEAADQLPQTAALKSESSSELGECEDTVGSNGWLPGHDVGAWISASNPVTAQAQVLICNVWMALQQLPREVLKLVATRVHKVVPAVTYATRAASGLLGLPYARVRRVVEALRKSGFAPVEAATNHGEPATCHGHAAASPEATDVSVLSTLVRAALWGNGTGGGEEFVRLVAWLSHEGVAVGDRYHTKQFAWAARYLAARCVQHYDAQDLSTKLGGLGIPSSMALLVDGVPVGGISLYGRHGSVEVICASFVNPSSGRLHARLLTWVIQSHGHGGAATADSILEAVAKEPWGLSIQKLRACLSCIGGDGAIVRGGGERKLRERKQQNWRGCACLGPLRRVWKIPTLPRWNPSPSRSSVPKTATRGSTTQHGYMPRPSGINSTGKI